MFATPRNMPRFAGGWRRDKTMAKFESEAHSHEIESCPKANVIGKPKE